MLLANLDVSVRKLFWGNLLLVVCSAFYLAWWVAAFKPRGASKGLGTKLLLLAAFAAGIAALAFMAQGISTVSRAAALFPAHSILWGGVAAYVILFALTYFLFRRQVTTELFLIVGWAMLEFSAIDALYGAGRFRFGSSVALVAVVGAAVLVSLVCYVLYYRLGGNAGYIDGMIPLIAGAVAMASVAAATVV